MRSMAPNEESYGGQEKANADLNVYEPKQHIKNEHFVLQSCNFFHSKPKV